MNNVISKLRGLDESNKLRQTLARGKNVYKGGSNRAHSGGGPQYGAPKGSMTGGFTGAPLPPGSIDRKKPVSSAMRGTIASYLSRM